MSYEAISATPGGADPRQLPKGAEATETMRGLLAALDQAAGQVNRALGAGALKATTAPAAPVMRRRNQKAKRSAPSWTPVSVTLLSGVVVTGIQLLSREAIWFSLRLPPLPYWYGYVPSEVLQSMVQLVGVAPLLASGPFVYPLLAVGIVFPLAKFIGLGKHKVNAIFRLAGFQWDRNSFCRGWLITGATGSGKTISVILTMFHQVFVNERGTLNEDWEGSELEAKVKEFDATYRPETEPIQARLAALREARARLDEDLKVALQRTLIGDMDYEALSAEARVARVEAVRATLEAIREEKLQTLRAERADLYERLKGLGVDWLSTPEDLEHAVAGIKAGIERLDRQMDELQRDAALVDPEEKSVAAADYRALQRAAAEKDAEIGRIEWQELDPLRRRYNGQRKRVEGAQYRSFPWGGLCIDEKGLFWQTLVPMARHHGREHHLMLLQTRPDWAPPAWEPPARFNLISDRKIKSSTYAKAIVDTATSVSGGEGDKAFFKTAGQKWIQASIDLQWGVRDFQLANGMPETHAVVPNLKQCLTLLMSLNAYRDWLIAEHVLQPDESAAQSPAGVGTAAASAAQAQAKKLASLVPQNPAFLDAMPRLLRETLHQFQREYWSQPPDQLGGITGTVNNYLTYFTGDDVAEVFCADNTFDIKDMDRGMILLLAMPQKLQTERRYVCTLLKMLFYQHVNDRFDLRADSAAWIHRNVLILWQDEAQAFASEADKVVDKIREAYGTTILSTQDQLSLMPPLGGKERSQVTMLNLRNRFILQVASEESAQACADYIGKHEIKRKDRSVSGQGTTLNYRSEDVHKVKPYVLRTLPKYTAIVCHCDGPFKRALIPPRDAQGRIAAWWLTREAPLLYKLGAKLGMLK